MPFNLLFFLFNGNLVTAALFQAEHLSALFEQRCAVIALRAFIRNRSVPCHKIAVWIVLAAEIFLALFGFLLKNLLVALGTNTPGVLDDTLCIGAVGESAAGKEFSEPSDLNYHRLSADLADLGSLLVGNSYPFSVHSLLRLGKGIRKISVEIAEGFHPVLVAYFDTVKIA